MVQTWKSGDAGVLRLPSGRLIRGRGLGRGTPSGPDPEFGLYLLGSKPDDVGWASKWLRWPDFGLPSDRALARKLFTEAWDRSPVERVEIACAGGRGRTGTALACIAILDGVPSGEAVAFIRAHYDRHAVETVWQRRFVRHFQAAG